MKVRQIAYIASPYTHTDSAVMLSRYEKVRDATAILQDREGGFSYYSPVTHGHNIFHNSAQVKLPIASHFWLDLCIPFLAAADSLLILPLEGWKESSGIKREIEIAVKLNISIGVITEELLENRIQLHNVKGCCDYVTALVDFHLSTPDKGTPKWPNQSSSKSRLN